MKKDLFIQLCDNAVPAYLLHHILEVTTVEHANMLWSSMRDKVLCLVTDTVHCVTESLCKIFDNCIVWYFENIDVPFPWAPGGGEVEYVESEELSKSLSEVLDKDMVFSIPKV